MAKPAKGRHRESHELLKRKRQVRAPRAPGQKGKYFRLGTGWRGSKKKTTKGDTAGEKNGGEGGHDPGVEGSKGHFKRIDRKGKTGGEKNDKPQEIGKKRSKSSSGEGKKHLQSLFRRRGGRGEDRHGFQTPTVRLNGQEGRNKGSAGWFVERPVVGGKTRGEWRLSKKKKEGGPRDLQLAATCQKRARWGPGWVLQKLKLAAGVSTKKDRDVVRGSQPANPVRWEG